MVKLYVNLIKAGRRTIDDVPSALREAVIAALEDEGYPVGAVANRFIGLTAQEVWASLSYRPTKAEYTQACDWLGIEYGENATNSELRALLAEACGVEEGA